MLIRTFAHTKRYERKKYFLERRLLDFDQILWEDIVATMPYANKIGG